MDSECFQVFAISWQHLHGELKWNHYHYYNYLHLILLFFKSDCRVSALWGEEVMQSSYPMGCILGQFGPDEWGLKIWFSTRTFIMAFCGDLTVVGVQGCQQLFIIEGVEDIFGKDGWLLVEQYILGSRFSINSLPAARKTLIVHIGTIKFCVPILTFLVAVNQPPSIFLIQPLEPSVGFLRIIKDGSHWTIIAIIIHHPSNLRSHFCSRTKLVFVAHPSIPVCKHLGLRDPFGFNKSPPSAPMLQGLNEFVFTCMLRNVGNFLLD